MSNRKIHVKRERNAADNAGRVRGKYIKKKKKKNGLERNKRAELWMHKYIGAGAEEQYYPCK